MTNRWLNRERLRQRLQAIPKAARAAVEKQIERNAIDFEKAVERAAPKESGLLLSRIGRRNISNAQRLAYAVWAGDDEAFYARFQEFGDGFGPPQPFFFPTYRARKRLYKSRINRAMRKALKAIYS